MQREFRRLFNQAQESFFVDDGEAAINGGHRRGAAGLLIDKRHFTEYAGGSHAFEHRASQVDLHGAFDDCEHPIARIPLFEDRLALLEGTDVWLATQDIECRHGATNLSKPTELSINLYRI